MAERLREDGAAAGPEDAADLGDRAGQIHVMEDVVAEDNVELRILVREHLTRPHVETDPPLQPAALRQPPRHVDHPG